MTAGLLSSVGRSPTRIVSIETNNIRRTKSHLQIRSIEYPPLPLHYRTPFPFLSFSVALTLRKKSFSVVACLSPSPRSSNSSTRLYISGLSFRTTEDSLRNAFKSFGQLLEVNLVMDKIANRPRGFAFLRYATEDESQKAIHGMHGKFLDGRVIFVEIAKPRSELDEALERTPGNIRRFQSLFPSRLVE